MVNNTHDVMTKKNCYKLYFCLKFCFFWPVLNLKLRMILNFKRDWNHGPSLGFSFQLLETPKGFNFLTKDAGFEPIFIELVMLSGLVKSICYNTLLLLKSNERNWFYTVNLLDKLYPRLISYLFSVGKSRQTNIDSNLLAYISGS